MNLNHYLDVFLELLGLCMIVLILVRMVKVISKENDLINNSLPRDQILSQEEDFFDLGDIVFHRKSKGYYFILATPITIVMEGTGERAYGYRRLIDGAMEGSIWIRCKKEMEDGRFVLVNKASKDDVIHLINEKSRLKDKTIHLVGDTEK